jgi:hypothetical protein
MTCPHESKKRALHTFFGRVLNAFCAEDVPREATQKLANLRDPLFKPGVPTMAATEVQIDQAIFAFGLVPIGIGTDEIVGEIPDEGESLKWRIEDIPETKDFVLSHCLRKSFDSCSTMDPSLIGIGSVLGNYAKNFERSSEAACRTALDFMLNEVLTAIVSIVVPSWVAFPFTFTSIRKAIT